MQAKPRDRQQNLYEVQLGFLCDSSQPLMRLSQVIDWSHFDEAFGNLYSEGQGRPAKPTRLMVGLHYLKHAQDLSDEEVVYQWVQNPYWQYFCGEETFQHELPIDPSSMTRWRNRLKSEGLEALLFETIHAGLKTKVLKRTSLQRLNVDTTVQEKAVTFPTDSKLYHRMREKLVKEANVCEVELRQSYKRLSKKSLIMQGRYRHARQGKRANKQVRKLKTYLGCVTRDIKRKIEGSPNLQEHFAPLLETAHRLLSQQRKDKNKLYSLHAPEVECIAKGKAHKKYEFGCKVSVATTSEDNFIVGSQALHGNPYDGHTLNGAVEQAERLGDFEAKEIYVDRGYRGHDYEGPAKVHLARTGMRKVKPTLRRWLKRRSAIEPVIGHMKTDGRLGRNYLLGVEGDRINAILCGAGHNIRKLLRAFLLFLFSWLFKTRFQSIAYKKPCYSLPTFAINRVFQGRLF
ncbi:MAG: IS5 family transposase, partial [Candidatus Marinimicrobia bacterium]|nr:IS5 family transposase [Candidatus Neomarinimicrobiota bacterium]